MPLIEIDLPENPAPLPKTVTRFIEWADERIAAFQESIGEQACPLFEPAEYAEVADVLMALHPQLQPGARFCEWGCGFGVMAGIADQCGLEAHGIEIDPLLLDQAQALHREAGLSTTFHQADLFDLSEEQDRAIGPATFDLIYAYPWPKEAPDWIRHFEATASTNALLITFHDFGEVRIQKKTDR